MSSTVCRWGESNIKRENFLLPGFHDSIPLLIKIPLYKPISGSSPSPQALWISFNLGASVHPILEAGNWGTVASLSLRNPFRKKKSVGVCWLRSLPWNSAWQRVQSTGLSGAPYIGSLDLLNLLRALAFSGSSDDVSNTKLRSQHVHRHGIMKWILIHQHHIFLKVLSC